MSLTVYHYTSPQGAFDILRNKSLRFTDCQYLNDMSELVYIREPLKEAYEKLREERHEEKDNLDRFLDSFFESPYEDIDWHGVFRNKKGSSININRISKVRYYVLCASKNADNANMWNYYVKDGIYRGYNMGLDVDVITSFFSSLLDDNIEFVSSNVIYDRTKQVDSFYQKLLELFNNFDRDISVINENDDDTPIIDRFQEDLYEYIIEKKLFFKNPAFASEHEYRFVLKVHDDFSENFDLKADFRVGASGIITPYVEWKFGNLKEKLLKRITLSPMIEPELAEDSFKRFLADDVYKSISIKMSTIKLRF